MSTYSTKRQKELQKRSQWVANRSSSTRGPPVAPPESRNPLSPTMCNVLESAGVTVIPSKRLISPIVFPVSSIDEKSPEDEPLSTLSLNSPKIEISHIVETLQHEGIEIRAHQDTRHDHIVQLLDLLLSGQAAEKRAVAENTQNINRLTKHHDTIAATSQTCISKIDNFEKKIEDFLSEQPDDYAASELPHLLPIPDVPVPTHIYRSATQPSLEANQASQVYHDRFYSLAPRVVPDTNFIFPVNPAQSQVKLTDLSAKSVFTWGELMEQEQQNYPYEVLQYGRYIHPRITKLIQAHNNDRDIYRPIILQGLFISMDNDQLWQLILNIVRPASTEEWMQIFKSLVRFTNVPQGYILDITKYDFYYTAIIEYI
jgi:hypothetical protein